ncbi:MAG: DUF1080 domain-containing protein [Opitutales bacterium]
MKKTFLISLASLFLLTSCKSTEDSCSTCCSKDNVTNLLACNDLSNWDYAFKEEVANSKDIFFMKDGVLNVTGKVFGYIYTKEEYSNFKLSLEWSMPQGKTNSGVFLYLTGEKKVWPSCVECQLMSGKAGDFILMNAPLIDIKRPNGTVRKGMQSVKMQNPTTELPLGEWNKAEIICENGNIKVYINGSLQNETTSTEKSGHIALQSEGGYLLFKNVNIEKL